MSEPPSEREWRFYLDDMIGFAERVLEYTDGLDQAEFEASAITYDATLRNLELIGEAATHVPQSVREDSAQVPWRQLIATRNRLFHGYLGIDNDTLWSIIRDDVSPLLDAACRLRDEHRQERAYLLGSWDKSATARRLTLAWGIYPVVSLLA